MATSGSDDAHQGAMIALMPSVEDAKRLSLKGGEAAAELHCTLMFLGGEASVFDEAARQEIIGAVMSYAAGMPPVDSKIFGVAHWNAGGDSPSWVWSVGDDPAVDGPGLGKIHAIVAMISEDISGDLLPDQHSPWVAHICAAYTDDLTLVKDLEKRNGPVTFDRIRVSFGDEDTDIPLSGGMTAAAGKMSYLYSVGDRIKIKGKPHAPGQDAGEIAEVNHGPAYGIRFDGMDDVHHWYVGEELVSEEVGMAASGQFRRKLTDLEVQSRADFAVIDKQWENAVGATMNDYARAEADQRAELREQIIAAVDSDDLGSLDSLHVSTDHMAALLIRHMTGLAITAGKEMQREAEHQGVRIPPWDLDTSLTASSAIDVIRSVARVTARSLGLGLVQSAGRRAVSFVTSGRSGKQVAAEVDSNLKDLSTRTPKDYIGSAMSSAQNAGRMAVLRVAPEGIYLASEINDRNTCSACQTIDGTEFTSLSAAAEAYPSGGGGYVNCAGGGRCRGTMIAVWDQAKIASAAVEVITVPWHVAKSSKCGSSKPWAVVKDATGEVEGCHETEAKAGKQMAALYAAEGGNAVATETETLGGKPNQGTKKDKRLKENPKAYAETDCPPGEDCADDMTAHLAVTEIVTAAWDGSASRFSDEQYKAATAACDSGDGSVKSRCFLPHHEPGGALNEQGLSAAAGRANQLGGRSAAAQARAKSHLRGHYNKLGKPVPSNLKATQDEVAAFALEDDYDLHIWGAPEVFADNGCPPSMEMDPATGECGPMKGGMESSGKTASWEGVLVVEDQVTGDGREFAAGALSWPETIEPGEVLLRWNKEDSHGGEARTKAVTVGRIDSIARDGNKIVGKGVFDLGSEDGTEAHRRVQEKFLRGVSIDADGIVNADTELVWPPDASEGEGDDPFEMIFAQPEKVIYHGGRIRAATLCDIPAFVEAYIALTDDSGAVVAGGAPTLEEATDTQNSIAAKRSKSKTHGRSLATALVAHGGATWKPPAEWFTNPQLSMPTTIQVTEDGRIYGHAAQWGACHIGFMDVCTQPPREDDFPYFLTGELITDDGERVPVGQITVTANHADLYAASGPAKEHYENTGNAVADVTVGADRIGIWVAGAVRPNADPMLVHELRASGEVSGDWRRIGGSHRLVGLLGVNVGGFVVPRMKARVAGGQVQALIAAGRLTTAHQSTAVSREMERELAYKIVMSDLAKEMTEGSE